MWNRYDTSNDDANEPDRPEWCPEWAPSKQTLDYLAVVGTCVALVVLIGLGTGVIKGEHFRHIGFSGIGGAGT